ncbi:MAG: oligosaccharide flippase family protein [Solirubrobacterales bacterium]
MSAGASRPAGSPRLDRPAPPAEGPIGRHVATLVSRDVVNRLARFGATVLLARALTLEDFGIVNTGIAIAGIAVTGTSLGLNELGARDVAVRPFAVSVRGRIASMVLTLRLAAMATVVCIALLAVAATSPTSLESAALIAAIALTMAASADWLLRGLERMSALGNATAIGGLTVLAGSAVLVATGGSAKAGLAVWLAGELVAMVLSWTWAGTGARLRVSRDAARTVLTRSWPLALSALALYVYQANLDTILLAAMRSVEEAGLYSPPYRVFLALNAVAIYTAYSYLPPLTRRVEAGDEQPGVEALRTGTRYLLAYAAVLLAGVELLGGAFLGTLFGEEFAAMDDTFTVLCIAIMWFSVGYPIGYTLIARHENRRFLFGTATGAILNVILNLILIPPFGPIGAAAATAVAFVVACLAWLWGHRLLGRATALDLIVMSSLSLAAVVTLHWEGLRGPVAAATLLTGVAVAWPLLRERMRRPQSA